VAPWPCQVQVHLDGITNHDAPPAIQGPHDGQLALPGLLQLIQDHYDYYDGFLIACFDDIGLYEAQQWQQQQQQHDDDGKKPKPIVAIGQAAYLEAFEEVVQTTQRMAAPSKSTMILKRPTFSFGVVTTVAAAIPVIQANVRQYQLDSYCSFVTAANIPVLDLEQCPDQAAPHVSHEVVHQLQRYSPNRHNHQEQEERGGSAVEVAAVVAIVLGCAGMANIQAKLEQDVHQAYYSDQEQPQPPHNETKYENDDDDDDGSDCYRPPPVVVRLIEPIAAGVRLLLRQTTTTTTTYAATTTTKTTVPLL
jgi:Asp/Glu/hydantoin racemase